jgi:hypothetical protein
MSPDEVKSRGLDPNTVYQISSEGAVTAVTGQKNADKPTEYQSKSAGFLARMTQAEQQYGKVPADSRDARTIPGQWLHDAFPGVDATFNSSDRNSSDNAARNFIAASLRQESGAAIGRDEYENQYRIFFPMPGDTEQQIKEKAIARQQAIEGFKVAAGPLAEQALASIIAPPDREAAPDAGDAVAKQGAGAEKAPPPLLQMPTPGQDVGQPMQATTGGMRAVPDPKLANELFAMLRAGRSIDEISQYAQSKGAAPIIANQETLDYAAKNPGWNPFTATRYEPVTAFERAVTPSGGSGALEQARDAAVGYATGAGQFLSGNTLDNLQDNPEQARLAMDLSAQASPTATAVGGVSGAILGSLAGEAMLARAGMGSGVLRSFLADAGTGAASGAGAADAPGENRLGGAVMGGLTAGGGSLVGSALGKGVNAVARGIKDPTTRQVINEVGDLTVGQTYGQSGKVGAMVKGIEDRLSGFPIVGDAINEARTRPLTNFNTKAFDRALAPIGQKLDGEVGQEAVAKAQQKVSDAFADALGGRQVAADAAFAKDMANATYKAFNIARVGPEVAESVGDILAPYMQQGKTTLTGEEMQIISRELQALKAGYVSDPLYKRVGDAIDATEEAVFGMFKRQAPDVLPKYNAAKQAFRRLSVLADATLKGKNQPDNMFTPAQLNQADAANAITYEGRINAAAGDRQFREFAEPAQEVLPNKVPDSGTAGRLLLSGAAVGGALGGGAGLAGGDAQDGALSGAGGGLALATILAGAYSKAGQRLLTKPGRGSQMLSDPQLQRILSKIGAATGVVSLLGTTPSQ